MQNFPTTIIWRHRKENLKKCSLRGLESRSDMMFLKYPTDALPDLTGYVTLAVDAPLLSEEDCHCGLFLIDATWNYSQVMLREAHKQQRLVLRSLPEHIRTAYPRYQTGCSDPERGLASVEALYMAYLLMGRETEGLLESYHWKETFMASV